jgi:hypothetical protein
LGLTALLRLAPAHQGSDLLKVLRWLRGSVIPLQSVNRNRPGYV